MISSHSVILALTTLMVLAVSSPVSRKCAPMQWESSVLGTVGQVNKGQGQVVQVVARFSVDYEKKMEVLAESVYYQDKFVGNYTYISTAKASYLVDTKNKKCTKLPSPQTPQRFCSDTKGLKYVTSMTIGTQMTDVYKFPYQGKSMSMTVLRDSFNIVSLVWEQQFAGIDQMVAFQYGNITEGIKDPSVFDLPKYC